ncbi:hypothetical protein [Maribellus maritimus]|uniref:hypothetical protein n=1 Tax=Maribellus maritimus TaxID=2870838 RepID=UPI001EEA892B|nr:hypothetical protein [Maribellus maritimus]MCG6188851.1 hypothetical protein [Maribellus maritimus]
MQQRKRRNRWDQTGIGFLAGFFVPLIIFFSVYFFGDSETSFSNYIKSLWHIHLLVKLGSLCVFANLAIFMGFIQKKYDKAAKGVLAATLIYAFAVLVSRAF